MSTPIVLHCWNVSGAAERIISNSLISISIQEGCGLQIHNTTFLWILKPDTPAIAQSCGLGHLEHQEHPDLLKFSNVQLFKHCGDGLHFAT